MEYMHTYCLFNEYRGWNIYLMSEWFYSTTKVIWLQEQIFALKNQTKLNHIHWNYFALEQTKYNQYEKTEYFPILKPESPRNEEFNLVQKRA